MYTDACDARAEHAKDIYYFYYYVIAVSVGRTALKVILRRSTKNYNIIIQVRVLIAAAMRGKKRSRTQAHAASVAGYIL